jgi:hypothetical protein
MAAAVERVRFAALTVASRAYRPTLPLRGRHAALGVEASDGAGLVDWLRAHGAVLQPAAASAADATSAASSDDGVAAAWELDCRASAGSLFVPAPENAVAHGDADLDVSDFLKSYVPPPQEA